MEIMNITQLTNAVKESGEQGARAYWKENRGDRGDLVVFEHLLFFVSDNLKKNWDTKDWIRIDSANQVHAPSIGHYNF